jgi:hypothetical protein
MGNWYGWLLLGAATCGLITRPWKLPALGTVFNLARLRSSDSRAVSGERHWPGNRGRASGFSMSLLFLQRILVEKQERLNLSLGE